MSDTPSTDKGLSQIEFWQLDLRYAPLRIVHRARQQQLVTSILEHGQKTPVMVVASEEPDRYVLIDGHGRVSALRALGRDTVTALVMPMSEAQGLVLSYRLDAGRRRTVFEEGWLVRELIEALGMKLAAAAVELGHSTSWVSRRLGLVRALPDSVQELVRGGRLSPHTAMSVLVPLSRGNAWAVEKIAKVVMREKLSSRQTAALCRAWSAASDAQREQLLERPVEYLRLQEAVASSPRGLTPIQKPTLVRDFEVLASVSRRAEGMLRDCGSDGDAPLGEAEALIVAWPRAREAFSALSRQVEVKLNAGSGYEDCDPASAPRG